MGPHAWYQASCGATNMVPSWLWALTRGTKLVEGPHTWYQAVCGARHMVPNWLWSFTRGTSAPSPAVGSHPSAGLSGARLLGLYSAAASATGEMLWLTLYRSGSGGSGTLRESGSTAAPQPTSLIHPLLYPEKHTFTLLCDITQH